MTVITCFSIIFAVIFGVFILWMAWKAQRGVSNANDFFFGLSGKRGFSFAFNAALTNFSLTSALIILPQLAISFGGSAQWVIWSGVLGVFVFGVPGLFPVPKKGDNERITLHSYVSGEGKWTPAARRLAAGITIVAYCGFIGATMVSLAKILAGFMGGFPTIWVVCLIAFSTTYLLLGGFEAIKKIDYIYIVAVAIGLALLVFCLMKGVDSGLWKWSFNGGNVGVKYAEMPQGLICALLLLNVFWQFVAFDMWERTYSIQENTTRGVLKASIWGAVLFLIMLTPFLVLGLAESQMDKDGTTASENPFIYFVNSLSHYFPGTTLGIAVLRFAFLLFAVCVHLSTVDTYLTSAGLALYKDLFNRGNLDLKKEGLARCRWAIAGVAVVSTCVGVAIAAGFWPAKLADILIDIFGIQLLLLPVLIYRRYFSEAGGHKVSTDGHALCSILVGVVAYVVFYIAWSGNPTLGFWVPAMGVLGAMVGLLGREFWRVWLAT